MCQCMLCRTRLVVAKLNLSPHEDLRPEPLELRPSLFTSTATAHGGNHPRHQTAPARPWLDQGNKKAAEANQGGNGQLSAGEE